MGVWECEGVRVWGCAGCGGMGVWVCPWGCEGVGVRWPQAREEGSRRPQPTARCPQQIALLLPLQAPPPLPCLGAQGLSGCSCEPRGGQHGGHPCDLHLQGGVQEVRCVAGGGGRQGGVCVRVHAHVCALRALILVRVSSGVALPPPPQRTMQRSKLLRVSPRPPPHLAGSSFKIGSRSGTA